MYPERMSESNDQAFIKISKELLCLRNDLTVMQKIQYATNYINQNSREALKDIRADRAHSDDFKGLSKILTMMADPVEMKAEIEKMKGRITKLEQLSEAYVAGKDIVQTRLQMD